LIQLGKQDIVFAGGGEEVHWTMTLLFDAMGALSSKYNDTPETASRPYDATRDGFVISGGGGVLVVEELEHARKRGARIYAELTGYGATSDGFDMVQPSGEGAARCMRQALSTAKHPVDYINAHGTSTPLNDRYETVAIQEVFGAHTEQMAVSSTKSMTGHMMGAAGAFEGFVCVRVVQTGCLPPTINYRHPDPELTLDYVPNEARQADVRVALSNSMGLGGHNSTVIVRRFEE
jgi:3-oxoacyl-[acyl-carrier-protein] synthase-1